MAGRGSCHLVNPSIHPAFGSGLCMMLEATLSQELCDDPDDAAACLPGLAEHLASDCIDNVLY